jgi:molecular chaperone HtpG
LCRFSTNESEDTISLAEYLEKMPETQKDIYYIAAETKCSSFSKSLTWKGFKSKNIPVLIMTDAIDQFWLPMIGSFKEKKFTFNHSRSNKFR